MKFFRRLRALFRKEELDKELSDELAFHLEKQIEQNMAAGMTAEEARYAALRSFGGVEQVKEECRDAWGVRFIDTLLQDIRFGLRMLAKNPGFTAVAVLTLAFGIGVNTAIFSLVDQLLLWSIPAREPNRLVKIEGVYSSTYPFFCAYRDLNQVFSGVLASSDNLDAGLRPSGAPAVELGHVEYVSGGYFQILGVGSAEGRVITPSDDVIAGGSPVMVLSYRYWQRRFGRDSRVIGQKLVVNTYPLIIVGVAEKGFGGLFNGNEPDAFIPLTMYPVTMPFAARTWNTALLFWLTTLARLKPGVSILQAQAGMQVLWSQVVRTVNDTVPKGGPSVPKSQANQLLLTPAARADSLIRNQRFLDPLKALTFATALVLLIACSNVANLLLARASQRWKETSVRLALGATRRRLIRQFLSESLLLSIGGGVVGLGLAWPWVSGLARLGILNPSFRFHFSFFVLLSCAGLTLLTSVLFGLVPAARATRIRLAESMNESSSATQTISRSRISKLLVACQVALSLMLLVIASLFVHTLRNLQNVDLGFHPENIAIFDIDPRNLGYRGQRLRTFYDRLLERVREVRGVRSAALSSMTPLDYYRRGVVYSAEGSQRKADFRPARYNPVSSGYFTTMGIPLLLGRDFRPGDEPAATPPDNPFGQFGRSAGGMVDVGQLVNASGVCIVDQTVARRLFGSSNPVGHHLCYSDDGCAGEKTIEIVGVVGAVHSGNVRTSDWLGSIYEPSWSNGADARSLLVRFEGNAASVMTRIHQALQEEDPNIPLLSVRMMEDYVNSNLARERLIAYLSSFFGMVALGLAAVGLYGGLAYAVSQRTREIGIRMAVGAQHSQVVGMILRECIVPVVGGLAVGLLAAFFWSLLLGSLLFGVSSFDPESTLFAVTVMLAAALLAAIIPARRATKVDPMTALRYE
jgi:predicted permease